MRATGASDLPGDHLERGGVGDRHHVGFLDAAEPLDRGAVEPHALGERTLELLGRDRERLQEPEHVGEPQPDEPDPPLLDRAQNELGFRGKHHPIRVGGACTATVTPV